MTDMADHLVVAHDLKRKPVTITSLTPLRRGAISS
jgi:hypothetical protein